MSGLFATLNVSKGAMFAQQQSINTTSHNIANANTEGYSRQNATLVTSRAQTISGGAGQIGTGVVVSQIERTRNKFLDFQIRKENATQAQYKVREDYLSEIEGIFNEPSDTGISKLLSKFYDAWQTLSTNADKSDARTVVAQQAKALADELNHISAQLSKTSENTKTEIQSTVYNINNMIDQLNQVNDEIIAVTVAGNNPNDLMDTRDLLLDKLSNEFGISSTSLSKNSLMLTPNGSNKQLIGYVDDATGTVTPINKLAYVSEETFSGADKLVKQPDGSYKGTLTYYKNGDITSSNNIVKETVTLTEAEYNSLNETKTIWTAEDGTIDPTKVETFKPESGKLVGVMTVYKDVDEYQAQLNTLAKALAYSVNSLHMEGYDNDRLFFVNSSDTTLDGLDNITAANIAVNSDILNNEMLINTGATSTSGTTDGTRALAIAQLRDYALNFAKVSGIGGTTMSYSDYVDEHLAYNADTNGDGTLDGFLGVPSTNKIAEGSTSESFFKTVINKLGVQSEEAKRIVKNQQNLLAGLEERRTSVSGVSLDEEMVNLIQFQHTYQANAKLISTVDELLDVVVNTLKR